MAAYKARPPKQKVIPVSIQNYHIRSKFPSFRGTVRRGKATWRGTLQPRISSPAYEIEIKYNLGSAPKVFITKPKLVENAPHLYDDGRLCLYWPKEWRWGRGILIADTILPWAAMWLFYYELWLDTGKWQGPSSHD